MSRISGRRHCRRSGAEAAVGAALDQAAAGEGMTVDPARRSEVLAYPMKLGELDHGARTRGFHIRQIGPEEVYVAPASAAKASGAPTPAPRPR